jgi:hypothetical protein
MSKIKSSNENLEIEAGGTGHEVEFLSDTIHGDSVKAKFGDGDDLTIFSDGGSFSYINNTQGVLRIRNTSDDQDVVIQSDNGSGGVTDYFAADGSTGAAKLYNYGSQKLATSSSGVDISGTATMDGLTVDGASAGTTVASLSGQYAGSGDVKLLAFERNGGAVAGAITYADASTGMEIGTTTAHTLALTTGDTPRLRIGNNGDISFYDDTGSAKFHWDAADERLGIGTNSPATKLAVSGGYISQTDGTRTLYLGSDGTGGLFGTTTDHYLRFITNNTERMRIESDGNIRVNDVIDNLTGTLTLNGRNTGKILFQSGGSEKMRMDASGNLLVGTTNANIYNTTGDQGVAIKTDNLQVQRANNEPLFLNRTGIDGTIISLRKDGSPVGSIGTTSGTFWIGSGDTGLVFDNSTVNSEQIRPYNTATGTRDAAIDLGSVGGRFKDLHLSGAAKTDTIANESTGTTTTSTTQTAIATFAKADYDSAKVVISAKAGTDVYSTELLIVHNGTTASATEYGQIGTGSALATFDVDISGSNVRVLATAASSTSTVFKVTKTLL